MNPKELTAVGLLRLVRDIRRDLDAMQQQNEIVARSTPHLADAPGQAALALALHHYYTALETLLSRVLRALEGDVPEGPDWHVALLEEASRHLEPLRPALLSSELLPALGELRRFRHFLRNAYSVSLDQERLSALAAIVERIHPDLSRDMEALLAFLDSLRTQLET